MEPFVGEIRMFAGDFAPRGWAFCDGQLIPIPANTQLFSLLGTVFGGDGKSTFALPNLQGRAPMHWGAGPGLTPREIGETGGTTAVTLTYEQLPVHSHTAKASSSIGSRPGPGGNVWARLNPRGGPDAYGGFTDAQAHMAVGAIQAAGGGQPHNNMQPYLGVSFIIALQGEYPQRP